MSKPLLNLALLGSIALFPAHHAFALERGKAGPGGKPLGAQAVPFGGAYSPTQVGKRPEDLKRPSASTCALRAQSGASAGRATRQEASGKTHVFNDPAALSKRSGNIYADCDAALPGMHARSKAAKPATAYNRSTHTLKAASDGYVNRSATSSMMPRKAPSMYDPATGVLRPAKKLDAYQIYQQ